MKLSELDFNKIYYTCNNKYGSPYNSDNAKHHGQYKIDNYNINSYECDDIKGNAHGVKEDDILIKWMSIRKIAEYFIDQNFLDEDCTLVPSPQHTGKAEYTLDIAEIIAKETGCKIADILECDPHDTLYDQKKRKVSKVSTGDLRLKSDAKLPNGKIYFLDNVIATGTTFNEVKKLVPGIKPLPYALSTKYDLKNRDGEWLVEATGGASYSIGNWDKLNDLKNYDVELKDKRRFRFSLTKLLNYITSGQPFSQSLEDFIRAKLDEKALKTLDITKDIFNKFNLTFSEIQSKLKDETKSMCLIYSDNDYKVVEYNHNVVRGYNEKVPESLRLLIDNNDDSVHVITHPKDDGVNLIENKNILFYIPATNSAYYEGLIVQSINENIEKYEYSELSDVENVDVISQKFERTINQVSIFLTKFCKKHNFIGISRYSNINGSCPNCFPNEHTCTNNPVDVYLVKEEIFSDFYNSNYDETNVRNLIRNGQIVLISLKSLIGLRPEIVKIGDVKYFDNYPEFKISLNKDKPFIEKKKMIIFNTEQGAYNILMEFSLDKVFVGLGDKHNSAGLLGNVGIALNSSCIEGHNAFIRALNFKNNLSNYSVDEIEYILKKISGIIPKDGKGTMVPHIKIF